MRIECEMCLFLAPSVQSSIFVAAGACDVLVSSVSCFFFRRTSVFVAAVGASSFSSLVLCKLRSRVQTRGCVSLHIRPCGEHNCLLQLVGILWQAWTRPRCTIHHENDVTHLTRVSLLLLCVFSLRAHNPLFLFFFYSSCTAVTCGGESLKLDASLTM